MTIAPADWYETIPMAHGVTLIHEPWIKPFYRCNMWHVRGRDRDLLVDSGLGAVSLRDHVALVGRDRDVLLVSTHTHFDHIGSAHEFAERLVHPEEAAIQADPRPGWTLADTYATDAMFDAAPAGWDAGAYRVRAAPATGLLRAGDRLDLGGRSLLVLEVPGHSPGQIALWEEATGMLIAADAVYDGPLVDDCWHSDVAAYRETLRRLRDLPVRIVHGGHFPSFGGVRFRQLIDAYLAGAAG
jgi:glyoxylase-like metal-dependent hydrolase (beta-lactamase superfamily II)